MKLGRNVIVTGIGTLAAAGVGAYAFLVRPWHLRWGATDEECKEPLPGDELVPQPRHVNTHAITINAPVADVWPWLAQIGQTRGGFYSYTSLENLVGCQMKNADHIVPEWQSLQAGDVVWLHPKAPPLPVLLVEPYQAMVLGRAMEGTWGLYLKQIDDKTTRLIVRGRYDSKPGLKGWLGNYVLFEPAHFVMERKMMLGIKERAEQMAVHRV